MRLGGASGSSVVRYRLLDASKALPGDCVAWDLVECLGDWLVALGGALLEGRENLPLFDPAPRTEADRGGAMDAQVRRLQDFTGARRRSAAGPTTHPFVDLIEEARRLTHMWIRALTGRFDQEYFAMHTRDADDAEWFKSVTVGYDIRKSTLRVDAAVEEGSRAAAEGLRAWRSRLRSVPKNWAVLFDGLVGAAHSDQEVVFFGEPDLALKATAVTLAHLEWLSLLEASRRRWPLEVKAAMGEGVVLVDSMGGQELSPPINHGFHAIKALLEAHLPVDHEGSICLVLENFADSHPRVGEFVDRTLPFTFSDGIAFPLEHPRLLVEWCGQLPRA